MFGRAKPDPREREEAILQCRVTLRKLQRQHRAMLERETRLARELKERRLESPSNDTKIKINYYLLQVIDKTLVRLSQIQDTDELNRTMNEFAGVLASVRKLSSGVEKTEKKALNRGIRRMEKEEKKEEKNLDAVLRSLETAGSGGMEAQWDAAEQSAAMRSADAASHPQTLDTGTEDVDMEEDMDEINRYLDGLISNL